MMCNRLNSTIPKTLGNSLQRTSIEFRSSLDKVSELSKDICWTCGGSGKLSAMTMAMTFDGGTVRGRDVKVDCKSCNGTGRN